MSGSHFQGTIKALLADDEAVALHRLRKLLSAHPAIDVIGEVMNGPAAVHFINRERPDLVFLDIRMPGCNGFEVLQNLSHKPLIVFVTAYEEYAIKAFEKNSLDYLLKPVDPERLAITIQRVLDNKTPGVDLVLRLGQLINTPRPQEPVRAIPVKSGNRITFASVEDIVYLEARDKYVYIHLHNQQKLVDNTLAYWQERLPPGFIRIHRSLIVNATHVRELQKYFKGTYIVVMDDEKATRLKSSYSYTAAIRKHLLLSE
jgi:two-component system LytT family response regulator